jgi:hypothetical protein
MRPRSPAGIALAWVISVLALVDGALHFALDYVLFHGNLFGALHFGPPPPPAGGGAAAGPPPPPPGPPPSNPILQALDISRITGLQLNQLFVLNAIGYIVLVVAFWLAPRLLGRWSWLVDVVLIVYTIASIIGWLDVGGPNPHGLGYLSKALEILLILALLAHVWLTNRPPLTTLRHRLRPST